MSSGIRRSVRAALLVLAALVTCVHSPIQGQALRFEPGSLATYFQVSPGSIVTREFTDPLGRVSNLRVYEFLVQARRSFSGATAIFFAYFYDADGIQIDVSPVQIQPMLFDWQPGTRARATIIMPVGNALSRVRLIQIRDLYGT